MWQRNVDRRQAHGRELRAGDRTGPADGDIGGGIGEVHAVDVGHRDVSGSGRTGILLRTDGVQYLMPGLQQSINRPADGPIDSASTLTAAEGQHRRGVGVETEVLSAFSTGSGTVEGGD